MDKQELVMMVSAVAVSLVLLIIFVVTMKRFMVSRVFACIFSVAALGILAYVKITHQEEMTDTVMVTLMLTNILATLYTLGPLVMVEDVSNYIFQYQGEDVFNITIHYKRAGWFVLLVAFVIGLMVLASSFWLPLILQLVLLFTNVVLIVVRALG